MQNIIIILFVLIPVLLLMYYVNQRDTVEKEPILLIIIMMILGMASVYFSKQIWNFILSKLPEIEEELTNRNWYVRILTSYGEIAFVEETIKYLLLNIIIYRNRNYDYMYDGIVYSVAISLGFALVEGLEYGIGNEVAVSLFRSVLTIPMHMSYGVIMGYYLSKSKNSYENRLIYYRYTALLFPIVLHGTSDYLLSTVDNPIIYIVYALFVYIIALKRINELSRLDKRI